MHRGRQCAALSVVALVLVGFTNGYWGASPGYAPAMTRQAVAVAGPPGPAGRPTSTSDAAAPSLPTTAGRPPAPQHITPPPAIPAAPLVRRPPANSSGRPLGPAPSIHDMDRDIFALAKARSAEDRFCPTFVGKLTRHAFQPSDSECGRAFEGVGKCSMIHRGRTGIGMRCTATPPQLPVEEVVLKRSILPVRYRFEMDEALVVCMLQLLRHFGVLESVMLIFHYLQCNSSVVQDFMAKHADAGERGRLGIPNTSTFLVLELVQSPQRRRVFTDSLLFELVYTLLTAYSIVRITICDLWARHLHMQLATSPRLYVAGGAACLLPNNTYALRLIDLSNHRHRRFDRVDQLLHASNYHLMFSRDMDNGAKLSTAARELYDWTRGPEFGRLAPEQALDTIPEKMEMGVGTLRKGAVLT
eukprot:EG_transcript_12248